MTDRDRETFEAFAARFAAVDAIVPHRPIVAQKRSGRSTTTLAAAAGAALVLVLGGAIGSRLLTSESAASPSGEASVVAVASPPSPAATTNPAKSPSQPLISLDPARPVETLRPPCHSHYTTDDRILTTPAQDAAASTSVVVARVIAVGAGQWNAADGRPRDQYAVDGWFDVMRLVRLEVETTIHGLAQPTVITVWVPGGTIGCDEFRLSWIPEITPGARYVVFLNATAPRTGLDVAGVWQLWSIDDDSVGTIPLDDMIARIRADLRSSPTP